MALPTPKAAVQIARLARATVHGTAHEAQRVVKARLQLWGHDIVTQRLFRTVYTLGEPQNEVTPLHMLRDIDEFFDESCHWLLVIGHVLLVTGHLSLAFSHSFSSSSKGIVRLSFDLSSMNCWNARLLRRVSTSLAISS